MPNRSIVIPLWTLMCLGEKDLHYLAVRRKKHTTEPYWAKANHNATCSNTKRARRLRRIGRSLALKYLRTAPVTKSPPRENDAVQLLNRILAEGNVKILFGLQAQGHIPTVERMVTEGATWAEIGKAIGWDGQTAMRHYSWYLAKKLGGPACLDRHPVEFKMTSGQLLDLHSELTTVQKLTKLLYQREDFHGTLCGLKTHLEIAKAIIDEAFAASRAAVEWNAYAATKNASPTETDDEEIAPNAWKDRLLQLVAEQPGLDAMDLSLALEQDGHTLPDGEPAKTLQSLAELGEVQKRKNGWEICA